MKCIEWLILDDGTEKVHDLFISSGLENIRYFSSNIKLNIGAKRNKLNSLAKGDIIVCMDDDDYYPPERISHAVNTLLCNPTINICGSSQLYLFYSDNKTIYKIGPYGPNHATNGTMAYRRSYIETHNYDEVVTNGEEMSFLNNYTEPMFQLDSFKTELLMSHSDNTFDKRNIRGPDSPVFKITQFQLAHFIKNKKLIDFYENA